MCPQSAINIWMNKLSTSFLNDQVHSFVWHQNGYIYTHMHSTCIRVLFQIILLCVFFYITMIKTNKVIGK